MPETHHAGGPRTDDHQSLNELLDTAARHLSRIGTTGHTLIDRARQANRPDGYPRSSSGGATPGGATNILWCDTHERDLTECRRRGDTTCEGVPVDTIPDPTGEAVIARLTPGHDELTNARRKLLTLLERATRDLERAASHLELLGQRPDNPDDTAWCSSCLRVQSFSVRFRGDLCNWCYKNRKGSDPPPVTLVDKHKRGIRITSADWSRHGYPIAS